MRNINKQKYLRKIPSVEKMLFHLKDTLKEYDHNLKVLVIREVLEDLRNKIKKVSFKNLEKEEISLDKIAQLIENSLRGKFKSSLKPLINATGIILHTNLGRALLAEKVIEKLSQSAARFNNLEFDLAEGKRGQRDEYVENLLCQLTGAESATVVNNDAAAVLLSLNTLAENKEVIVSRGQLVEIGGSFRVPEIMEKSGAKLIEVGTTNRTHLYDYERAITERTAILLRVHTSNYRIVGFSCEVALSELVKLAHKNSLIVMEDLGSGCMIELSKFGLPAEPLVQNSVKTGADIITFSGDKLLGGPQAGIILGKKKYIELIRKNPLMRIMRVGKLIITALESTLLLYQDEKMAIAQLPVFKFIGKPLLQIKEEAEKIKNSLRENKNLKITVEDGYSQMGSGSLPGENIPTKLLKIEAKKYSVENLAKKLRENEIPLIGKIERGFLKLDLRTVLTEEIEEIIAALKKIN